LAPPDLDDDYPMPSNLDDDHPSFAHQSPMVSDNEFPPMQDDLDVSGIPMEDSMLDPTSNRSRSDSLHPTDELPETQRQRRSSLNLDGLEKDLSVEEEEEDEGENSAADKTQSDKKKKTTKKRNPIPTTGPRRLRKKRKVTLDESIELSSDHIREMLRDTSDIVLQNRSHPADYVVPSPNEDEDEDGVSRHFSIHARKRRRLQQRMGRQDRSSHPSDPENVSILSYDILLTRPNIADSGMLAPELLNLWAMNAARLLGKDRLPFRMRGTQIHRPQEEKEEEEEGVESTRRRNDDQFSFPQNEPMEEEEVDDRDNHPFPSGDDMEFPLMSSPLETSADYPAAMDQEYLPFTDDAVRFENSEKSPASQGDFSLGAVNDLENDFENDPEEDSRYLNESGDVSVARTTSHWHKHTIKVLSMLKKNMTTSRDTPLNEDDEHSTSDENPTSLSYNIITNAASRRTAVGVFFELLQLKTWDFIELEQNESYGDIQIVAGPRFHEDAPMTA
jgi:hypothetical protein